MSLTTGQLSDVLAEEAFDQLRRLDGVLLVVAELEQPLSWKPELASFSASPAEHLMVFRQN